jgi:hypothetical protein
MQRKEAVIKEIHQKEGIEEVGHSSIDNRSKSQFLGSFDSYENPFLFLVSFCLLLDASK